MPNKVHLRITTTSFLIMMCCVSGCGLSSHPKLNSKTLPAAKPLLAKPPLIGEASSKQNILAYVNYYKSNGFVVSNNKQAFDSEGRLLSFQFAASRSAGTASETAAANINATTHTTSVSSSTTSSSSVTAGS